MPEIPEFSRQLSNFQTSSPEDPFIAALDEVRAERDRLRAALTSILNHGQTHDEPCWALHGGDCADTMQEIARAALASGN